MTDSLEFLRVDLNSVLETYGPVSILLADGSVNEKLATDPSAVFSTHEWFQWFYLGDVWNSYRDNLQIFHRCFISSKFLNKILDEPRTDNSKTFSSI